MIKPLILGIEEMYQNHPLPKLDNFRLVSWQEKDLLNSADIYVQNNILEQKRKKFRPYYQYILDSKKPFLVTESAVFRRNMPVPPNPKAYHRYSWYSYFRDEGNYNNKNSPPDRWLQIQKDQNIEIKDWKRNGEYILFIMQRPGDSSLKNLLKRYNTYENFIQRTLNEIRKYTDRKIKIRLHPLRQDRQHDVLSKCNLKGIEISQNTRIDHPLQGGDGLYEDFKNAKIVVGFNSNALTESVCEGIPTFSLCPSSMAWEASNTDLSLIENPIIDIPREQWLYNLGYCQWREDEIERGDPWFHLKKLYGSIIK